MIGEFKNVVITRKMEEIGYCVYYSIQVATQKDAVQLIQRMLYSGHTLNMRDINAYAGPVIEKAVNQFFLITPQGLQIVQDLSQLIHQRLQPFLSNYGITLGMVKVHTLRPHDTHLHSQGQFLKRETREQSAIPHVIRLVPLESHAPEAHHPKSSNH